MYVKIVAEVADIPKTGKTVALIRAHDQGGDVLGMDVLVRDDNQTMGEFRALVGDVVTMMEDRYL